MLEAKVNRRFVEQQAETVSGKPISWNQRVNRILDRLICKDEKEFLEDPAVPLETRVSLIGQLNRLNNRSGYHYLFLKTLEKLLAPISIAFPSRPVKILDVGVGGGGLLEAIHHWAKRKKTRVELAGVDLSDHFIQMTHSQLAAQGISVSLMQGDACALDNLENDSFDIVISSYMVHHIRAAGKVALFLSEVYRIARYGWLIVDLDRRVYGPLFVTLAGFLFGAPKPLVADGVKSARRAYKASELKLILNEIEKIGGISNMTCLPYPVIPYWIIGGRKNNHLCLHNSTEHER
jgi:ubiquinone/menaquinone biosynthesis C-methylase UbiE